MSRRRKLRELSDEERKLWNSVASTVARIEARAISTPYSDETRANTAKRVTPDQPPAPAPAALPPIASFRVGQKAGKTGNRFDPAPTLEARLAEMSSQTDKRTRAQLKRGKLKPEARIDLHGLTQAQAHPRLVRFILDAYDRQLRLVLVITGKGKDKDEGGPMPVPRGVLRHMVPQWLGSGALSPAVLQVTQAHIRHGGEGAYYVSLRRRRP